MFVRCRSDPCQPFRSGWHTNGCTPRIDIAILSIHKNSPVGCLRPRESQLWFIWLVSVIHKYGCDLLVYVMIISVYKQWIIRLVLSAHRPKCHYAVPLAHARRVQACQTALLKRLRRSPIANTVLRLAAEGAVRVYATSAVMCMVLTRV